MILSWLLNLLKKRGTEKSNKKIAKLLTPLKFSELEALVGFSIKNRSYFIQALMHRSFLEQNNEYELSNERLEFLGDSILSLIVAEYLYTTFPNKDEGFLTKIRAKLVNRIDRKSTRLNSSHLGISYAVFCLKKKKKRHREV